MLIALHAAVLFVFATSEAVWVHAASSFPPWALRFPDGLGGEPAQRALTVFGCFAVPLLGIVLAFLALKNADDEAESVRKKANSLIFNSLLYLGLLIGGGGLAAAYRYWELIT